MTKISSKITRRNCLQLLLATGGGLIGAGLLRVLESTDILTPATADTASSIYLDRIKNIVIFVQENHSFDSLFAGFPGANSKFVEQQCTDSLRRDPPHEHLDSFRPHGATSDEANCSYTETDTSNYWNVARAFTLCDNYFSDVRSSSYPNYLMMISGQSPIINAPSPFYICPGFCLDIPTLADQLDARGVTWRDYGGIFAAIKNLIGRREIVDDQDEKFFEDVKEGTLPNVSWLFSGILTGGDAKSGHPPASLCGGQNYAVSVLNAVMNGPQWSTTALFLVWDDWGGFYDHVEPPIVERWEDGTPFRYGHRVPCIVVSPYARAGYVSHALHSHVSLLRFIETMFGLEPLTERDANASNMLDCFDFVQSPLLPFLLTARQCP